MGPFRVPWSAICCCFLQLKRSPVFVPAYKPALGFPAWIRPTLNSHACVLGMGYTFLFPRPEGVGSFALLSATCCRFPSMRMHSTYSKHPTKPVMRLGSNSHDLTRMCCRQVVPRAPLSAMYCRHFPNSHDVHCRQGTHMHVPQADSSTCHCPPCIAAFPQLT